MASPERLYHGSVRIFSAVFVLLGLAILVSTLANGGGVLSLGVVLGTAFLLVGVARGWRGGWGGRGRTVARPQRPPTPHDRTRGQSPS